MARYLPFNDVLADASVKLTKVWQDFIRTLASDLDTARTTLATVPGVNYFTIATQPSLGASNVGYVGYEKDTAHFVWFDGTSWQPLDDGAGYFRHCPVAPAGVGWQRCDGTATTYLVLGNPTLTTAAFTTPNLSGTPAYLKDGAYTGTINAKAGSTGTGTTGTGTTGTGTTGTGTTGDESSHTHGPGSFQVDANQTSVTGLTPPTAFTTYDNTIANAIHGTSGAGSVHNHSVPGLSVPGLSVPGLSVPALGVGTIEMANVAAPIYFRR